MEGNVCRDGWGWKDILVGTDGDGFFLRGRVGMELIPAPVQLSYIYVCMYYNLSSLLAIYLTFVSQEVPYRDTICE